MKNFYIVFAFFFLFTSLISGQITLTKSDVQIIYAIGNSLTSHEDTLTTNVNIGAPGNNTWDFLDLKSHFAVTSTSVNPVTSPYIGEFPGSNLVLLTPETMMGVPASFYSYVTVTDDAFNVSSAKMEVTLPTMSIGQKLVNSPAEKSFIFPMTYLTEWTDIFQFTASSFLNGAPMNSYTENHRKHYKCDAYGTIRTPYNEILPALRLREDETRYEAATGDYSREISYEIVALNGFSVSFSAVDTLAPDNGFIDVTDVLWTTSGTVDVQPHPFIPSDFNLEQNYPNPFNPATTIKFSISEPSQVSLVIYDVLGNEVETIINDNLQSGAYSSVWLPLSNISGGVYFCRLTANNLAKTIKMIYLK